MSKFDAIVKVLLLGESMVGKSSVILRYINDKFEPKVLSTVGVDFKNKIVSLGDKKIKVILFDTSGQERYHNLTSNYYKNCDCILCVYDVTYRHSFLKIDYWLDQIKQNTNIELITLALFANKTDIVEREVTSDEGKKMADKYQIGYYEGSALKGDHITKAIEGLILPFVNSNGLLEETNNTSIKLNEIVQNNKKQEKESGCC